MNKKNVKYEGGPLLPHTPGPWTRMTDDPMIPGSIVALNDPRGHRNIPIGQVYGLGGEAVGNAALLAAAPDLLAALIAILERSSGRLYDTDQETGETFDVIAAKAIAKAEGRA